MAEPRPGHRAVREEGDTPMSQPDTSMVDVLLVEDDAADALLTREAMERDHVGNALHVVSDGMEAMAFLRQEGAYAGAPRPGLILLDLNMPRMDGREVLALIKADEELCSIPVVVLTTSDAEADVLRSYQLHANAYVSKPVDLDRFTQVVRSIDEFYLVVVKLPHGHGKDNSRGSIPSGTN
jgi:CheY-like chemotaxis protein